MTGNNFTYSIPPNLDILDFSGGTDEPGRYDLVRSNFRNLSLLDRNTNSSLNSKTISSKLIGYCNARSITHGNEPEFLVQSFSKDSEFYKSEEIKKLGLPTRTLVIDDNSVTWSHSDDNEKFIKALSKMAVDELFK
jgi:hypothetical protein